MLKRVLALLLLSIFLAPHAGKLFHHHHHRVENSCHQDHSSISEVCLVCNFELCAFKTGKSIISSQPERHFTNYLVPAIPSLVSFTGAFSFLLRAPPC
jgi:hypothetical protein